MRNRFFVTPLSFLLFASGHAIGQDAVPPTETKTSEQLEKITVTATKREETLQEVPISVSVTSQATLERAHIRDLIDLQSVVPSLKVTQFNAVGRLPLVGRQGRGAGLPVASASRTARPKV